MMKKKYMTPQTESVSLVLNANMLAGSNRSGGLEQDQNDDGGSCAKGYWGFEETPFSDDNHTTAWDSF